jgi:DNA gyrase subunit B
MCQEANNQMQTDVEMTLRDGIRKRASMYIGDVGEWGLHNMVNDILDDALCEAAKGFARSISIILRRDGSLKIQDDGRGLQAAFLEDALLKTRLHWKSYRIERDILPIAVACCLSDRLRIENRHEGRRFVQEFQKGIPLGQPMESGPFEESGIVLEFMPDVEIFPDARLNSAILRERLEECALLHSGIRISFLDESTGAESRFNFENGIRSFVTKLNESRTALHDVAVFRGQEQGIGFEVGIQFCKERHEVMQGYVNDYRCDMGTHLTGVRVALTQSLKRFARAADSFSNASIQWASRGKGLTAVISIRMAEPHFYGSTREKLASLDVQNVLVKEFGKRLDEYFAANPNAATAIIRAGLHQ